MRAMGASGVRSMGLAAFLVALSCSSGPAAAQIDVSGAWRFGYAFPGGIAEADVALLQSGSALTTGDGFTGSIDPVTGAFHLGRLRHCTTLEDPTGFDVPVSIDGTFATDGESFTGTFAEVTQVGRSCVPVAGQAGGVRVRRFTCGDGIVDATEACDGGPCCAADCQGGPPDGTVCGTDPTTCLDLVCDATHACVLGSEDTVEDECVPQPGTTSTSSTSTSVSTTTTSTSSTTTTTAPNLVSARKVRLIDGGAPNRRRLLVESRDPAFSLGLGGGSADDPTVAGATLRVRTADSDMLYELPAIGWSRLDRGGYRYRDAERLVGPVTAVKVREGTLLSLRAKGAALGHTLATDPRPVEIVLTLGIRRSCVRIGAGATSTFVPGARLTAIDEPAPAACPP